VITFRDVYRFAQLHCVWLHWSWWTVALCVCACVRACVRVELENALVCAEKERAPLLFSALVSSANQNARSARMPAVRHSQQHAARWLLLVRDDVIVIFLFYLYWKFENITVLWQFCHTREQCTQDSSPELFIPLSVTFIETCWFNLLHTAITFRHFFTVSLWAQNLPVQKIVSSTLVCFCLSDWSHDSRPFTGFTWSLVFMF